MLIIFFHTSVTTCTVQQHTDTIIYVVKIQPIKTSELFSGPTIWIPTIQGFKWKYWSRLLTIQSLSKPSPYLMWKICLIYRKVCQCPLSRDLELGRRKLHNPTLGAVPLAIVYVVGPHRACLLAHRTPGAPAPGTEVSKVGACSQICSHVWFGQDNKLKFNLNR